MDMLEDNEFQGIGKKTPYKTPDGFFEQVSEKTLLIAKQRDQNDRKIRVLWRTVVAVASMAAIVLLGYFILVPDTKNETSLIVQNKQPVEEQMSQKQEVIRQSEVAEIKTAKPEKIISEVNSTEGVNDVLSELSDEDLLQLAAMIKTDPFISESVQ